MDKMLNGSETEMVDESRKMKKEVRWLLLVRTAERMMRCRMDCTRSFVEQLFNRRSVDVFNHRW